MTRRLVGLILLLIGSEALGIYGGECFYKLFVKLVPPIAMSTFNMGTARAAFLGYGALAGLLVFVWAAIAALLAPLFRGPSTRERERA